MQSITLQRYLFHQMELHSWFNVIDHPLMNFQKEFHLKLNIITANIMQIRMYTLNALSIF
ncbi:hypothetical protein DDJ70_03690 [Klebsiella michiganensis]|uniref:Uncharacterized protein n=1 Tax=Klebsiella michiganensis TaxID=1134687 RepID=A0A2J4YS90_9ENTR|nr:hypothetical protein CWM85_24930 [Klebsiella michiganensis]RFC13661.1 hypothetical protein DDJ70_03690 [Klebsiella michiganensis]